MAKDGKENLVPLNERTKEEQSEITRKGGIASGKARREKRDLKKCLNILLEKDIKSRNGEVMSGAEAISAKLFEKALKGDVKAFIALRDTAGQKPVDKIVTSDVSEDTIQEVSDMVEKMKALKNENND